MAWCPCWALMQRAGVVLPLCFTCSLRTAGSQAAPLHGRYDSKCLRQSSRGARIVASEARPALHATPRLHSPRGWLHASRPPPPRRLGGRGKQGKAVDKVTPFTCIC